MQIVFHRNFEKRFKKLSPQIKKKATAVIKKFKKNPFDRSLKNHPLKGKLSDKRAISVTDDIRIVFEEYDSYILILILDIGTHPQVYS